MFCAQSLHSNQREVAELTLLFHPDSRHSFERLIDILGVFTLERLGCYHLGSDRNILYVMLRARTCHHHLIKIKHILFQFKEYLNSLVLLHIHLNLLFTITHQSGRNGLLANRQICEFEMAAGIGHSVQLRVLHCNHRIAQMFACSLALYVSKEHGVGLLCQHVDHTEQKHHDKGKFSHKGLSLFEMAAKLKRCRQPSNT